MRCDALSVEPNDASLGRPAIIGRARPITVSPLDATFGAFCLPGSAEGRAAAGLGARGGSRLGARRVRCCSV